jgi:hypothetical protein
VSSGCIKNDLARPLSQRHLVEKAAGHFGPGIIETGENARGSNRGARYGRIFPDEKGNDTGAKPRAKIRSIDIRGIFAMSELSLP